MVVESHGSDGFVEFNRQRIIRVEPPRDADQVLRGGSA